jgi:Rrf2 family protein
MSSILKVSEAVSLGLHACVIMAGQNGERFTAPALAEMIQASEAHLSKVMQRLVKAGLIKSNRGPGGGFTIAKRLMDISLMDIYEAIEGSFPSENCLFENHVCGRERCALGDFLANINKECKDYFENTRLGDLV